MANKTGIEWTDYTLNPITGCTRISDACKNCYAHAIAARWLDGKFDITFHPERLSSINKIKTPSSIFVGSMTDMFHENVNPKWLDIIFDFISDYPQHKFLFLTKRPQNIPNKLLDRWLSNWWLGITLENYSKPCLDRWESFRPIQYKHKTINTFCSFEPFLFTTTSGPYGPYYVDDFKWLIYGGETGAGARKMDLRVLSEVMLYPVSRNIPVFFKKFGTALKVIPEEYRWVSAYKQFPEEFYNTLK